MISRIVSPIGGFVDFSLSLIDKLGSFLSMAAEFTVLSVIGSLKINFGALKFFVSGTKFGRFWSPTV